MKTYPYFTKTQITRLPTRRESGDDNDLYMGYNLCTKCNICDGTGFVIEVRPSVFLPVFGNEIELQVYGLPIKCCPHCNSHQITPRDLCVVCCKNSGVDYFIQGQKYIGSRMSWKEERMVVFNGYLCDQCAQTIKDDGGKLR